MLDYFSPSTPHYVFQSKVVVKNGYELGHLQAGEIVGVGFPYIHNVYRILTNGELSFLYHWDENKLAYMHLGC